MTPERREQVEEKFARLRERDRLHGPAYGGLARADFRDGRHASHAQLPSFGSGMASGCA